MRRYGPRGESPPRKGTGTTGLHQVCPQRKTDGPKEGEKRGAAKLSYLDGAEHPAFTAPPDPADPLP